MYWSRKPSVNNMNTSRSINRGFSCDTATRARHNNKPQAIAMIRWWYCGNCGVCYNHWIIAIIAWKMHTKYILCENKWNRDLIMDVDGAFSLSNEFEEPNSLGFQQNCYSSFWLTFDVPFNTRSRNHTSYIHNIRCLNKTDQSSILLCNMDTT